MDPAGFFVDRLSETFDAHPMYVPWSAFASFDDCEDNDKNTNGQDQVYASEGGVYSSNFDTSECSTSESSLTSLSNSLDLPPHSFPNCHSLACESPREDPVGHFQPRFVDYVHPAIPVSPDITGPSSANGVKQSTPSDTQTTSYRCIQPGCFGVSFKRKHDLIRHRARHSPDSIRYVCGECRDEGQGNTQPALFFRKDKLRGHLRKYHHLPDEQSRIFPCPLQPCNSYNRATSFSTQLSLEAHMNIVHKVANEPINVAVSEKNDKIFTHLAAAPPAPPAVELVNEDQSEQPEMLQPSCIASTSKHPLPSTFQPEAKREKLEHDSRPSAQISPTDDQQDISLPGPSSSPHNGVHKSGQQKKGEETPEGVSSINRACNNLPNGIALAQEGTVAGQTSFEPQDCKEIKSVRTLEMLALLRLNVVPTEVMDLENFEISFNFRERAIKLKGPSSATAHVKAEVEGGLSEVRRLSPKEPSSTLPARCGFATKGLNRVRSKISAVPASSAVTPTIFAIRTTEDSSVITTWMALIEPQIDDILAPLIGGEYSAGLVRQHSTKGSVIPTIRIQSPTGQSKSARGQIRDQINRICESHNRAKIPLQFSKGSVVRLILTAATDEALWEYEPMEDDQPNEQLDFPHHRRYYPRPGMSSSVGLGGCDDVSATLGGYIQIDTAVYMLTVDHFIGAARDLTPTEVTSPSLLDRNELTELLKQELRDIEARINQVVLQYSPSGDVQLVQQPMAGQVILGLLPTDAREIIAAYEIGTIAIQRYQNDLNRKTEDYTLGNICQRRQSESRLSSVDFSFSSPNGGQESTQLYHRMDWSVSEVKAPRRGVNQYGPDFHIETGSEDPNTERFNPRGAGIPFQNTCKIEPGTAVYYFGQTSGLQRGHISAAPISIKIDEVSSKEWTIVTPQGMQYPSDHYQGDSGAWIIRESDNAVVGLLWGWVNGQLVFTPIAEVFADIKDTLNPTEITLPHQRRFNEPTNLTRICRVKSKDDPQKSVRYKSAIPIRQQPLAALVTRPVEIRPLPRGPQVPAETELPTEDPPPDLMPTSEQNANIRLPRNLTDGDREATVVNRPQSRCASPVPSLCSSVSSSPTLAPGSLSVVAEQLLQADHVDSEDPPVVILAEGNENYEQDDEGSDDCALQHVWGAARKARQDARLSIGYILEDLGLAKVSMADFTHERLKRSTGTWPAVETWRRGDGMVTK